MGKVLILLISLSIILGGLCLIHAVLNPILMRGFYKSYKAKGGKKSYEEYKKLFK